MIGFSRENREVHTTGKAQRGCAQTRSFLIVSSSSSSGSLKSGTAFSFLEFLFPAVICRKRVDGMSGGDEWAGAEKKCLRFQHLPMISGEMGKQGTLTQALNESSSWNGTGGPSAVSPPLAAAAMSPTTRIEGLCGQRSKEERKVLGFTPLESEKVGIGAG